MQRPILYHAPPSFYSQIARLVLADPDVARGVEQAYERSFDELDEVLSERPFVAGSRYSLADVAWTVTVSRRHMLGRSPLEGRQHLARWYTTIRDRPSFERAGVWERFRFLELLAVVAWKLRYVLFALVAGTVIVVATCALG